MEFPWAYVVGSSQADQFSIGGCLLRLALASPDCCSRFSSLQFIVKPLVTWLEELGSDSEIDRFRVQIRDSR